jgi:murein DD-endopeptidase MepM/ murein hydrolase activator NlpD
MWLLDWLNDRWSKVTAWFGSFFWTAWDRLKNFWGYLNSIKRSAYDWAVNTLVPKINAALVTARSYADGLISNTRSWVWSRVSSIYTFIHDRVAELRSKINTGVNWAVGKAQDLFDTARGEYLSIRADILAAARNLINSRLNPFGWVLNYKSFIEDLAKIFNPDNRKKIIPLLGEWFDTLAAFAGNPFGFMIGLIEPVFVDLLAWTLAYALGAEDAELPSPPSWSDLRPGGGGPAPTVPPDVARGLKAPLNSLWISGYTYEAGHRALDLGLERGDPVYAMHSGVIEYINEAYTGYGFQIVIRGDVWWSRYAHLDEIEVRRGQTVQAGDYIGRGNSTGNSTGDHLHLEIKYQNQFIDPAQVLGLR